MEIEDLRAAMTVVSFASFLAIVAWAYGRGRKERFAEAARLPFDEDRGDEQAASSPVCAPRPGVCAQRAGAESGR